MSNKRKKNKSPTNNQNRKKSKKNSQKTMDNSGGKSDKDNKGEQKTANPTNPTNQASQSNGNNVANQTFPLYNGSNTNASFMSMLNSPPHMVNQNYPVQQQYQQYQQCSTPVQTMNPCPDFFSIIIQRLDSLDSKLSQLDSIQKSVKGISSRIDKMEQRIKHNEEKVKELEEVKKFDASIFEDMSNKQKEIDSVLSKVGKIEKVQNDNEKRLHEDVIDLKCRSMRDNLVFYRIQEETGEQCEEKILSFMENELKIDNAKSEIKLHRVHRIGEAKRGYTRPIVAKFAYYPDREKVRKSARNLKNTIYALSEQFPKEIIERRKALIPVMKEARKNGKLANLVVDKLYIDNQLYRGNR